MLDKVSGPVRPLLPFVRPKDRGSLFFRRGKYFHLAAFQAQRERVPTVALGLGCARTSWASFLPVPYIRYIILVNHAADAPYACRHRLFLCDLEVPDLSRVRNVR